MDWRLYERPNLPTVTVLPAMEAERAALVNTDPVLLNSDPVVDRGYLLGPKPGMEVAIDPAAGGGTGIVMAVNHEAGSAQVHTNRGLIHTIWAHLTW